MAWRYGNRASRSTGFVTRKSVASGSDREGYALEKVEAVVLHSDTPRTGTFKCSHPLLNQLAHNILWGQKGNFLEVPTDCPQRDERLGWTGDAQVFIRTAAFHMDVRGFFHKWLKDMRDAQDADGAIPAVIPNPVMPSVPMAARPGPTRRSSARGRFISATATSTSCAKTTR